MFDLERLISDLNIKKSDLADIMLNFEPFINTQKNRDHLI